MTARPCAESADFRAYIERVRERSDIHEVIGERVELSSKGMGRCPFHDDSTPSFSVRAEGQYFHCFGCQVGGDVFRFVERIEKVGFREAVDILADRAGIARYAGSEEDLAAVRARREVEDVLGLAAAYYHGRLTPEARAYFTEKRGLPEEFLERFEVGWADGGLRAHLRERGISDDAGIRAGVLVEHEGRVRDFLFRRMIFPERHRGRVTSLTSRAINDAKKPWLHLKGDRTLVYHADALGGKEVYVTEGVFDVLTLEAWGLPAVAVLGTGAKHEELVRRLARVERVNLCLDADGPGRSGASVLGRALGLRARIVVFPEGQDPNDLLVAGQREVFDRCVAEARDPITAQIEAIPADTDKVQLPDRLAPVLEQLAGLDEAKTEAFLAGPIKKRFQLKAKDLEPYRKDRKAVKTARRRRAKPAAAEAEGTRPAILVTGGELPAIVDRVEAVLLDAPQPLLFQRQGLLVRPVRLDGGSNASGVRRQAGSLVLLLVDEAYLIDLFTRLICFRKLDRRSGELRAIDCPKAVAETYLARKGAWNVPVLEGVIEAPTLREDGSVLDQPGYDVQAQLLFDPGGVAFDPIPDQPSREDAQAALQQLREIIQGFPFVAESDRTTALAAILTVPVRRSLPTAPMFVVRAPTMGSGKSLLVDVMAMNATGRPAAVMSQGKDEDEERKRIFALLLEGASVVSIDNIERPLKGDALCSVLTQRFYKDRVLGRSGTATVPTTSTFFATGNNLLIQGDLTSRVVVCDLDAGCERPEERKFDVNLYRLVPEQRHRLVPAALTVLRAYQVAGCPDQGLVPFGRFEKWSQWVRSALVWLGEADPCAGRSRVAESDPERETLVAVLASWHRVIGSRPVAVKELAQTSDPELLEALAGVAANKDGALDPRRLGRWLKRHVLRIVEGRRIERVDEHHGSARWRVVVVPAPDAVGSVGLVGPFQAPARNCQTDVHIKNDSLYEGLGNIPPNPQIPPAGESADGDDGGGGVPEGEAAEPLRGKVGLAEPCRACGETRRWWACGARDWICGRCHPPAAGADRVVWSDDEPRAEPGGAA